METQAFTTIKSASSFELKERGSKFLAFAYPIENELNVKTHLDDLKLAFPDATHHCYAFKFFDSYRANDDGEPKNSAGMPIYRQILSESLDCVLVIVVRYYGGKNLGVSGLVKAYGDAAKQCLNIAERITAIPKKTYAIRCTENSQYLVYEFCNRLGVSPEIDDINLFKITIESNMTSKLDELCEIYVTLDVYLNQ